MKNKFIILLLSFCILLGINCNTKAYDKNKNNLYKNYKIFKEFNDILSDKKFIIHFSNSLDKNSIEDDTIEIRDENKNNVPIDVNIIDNKIEISARKNLVEGKNYYLIVHSNIKGKKTKHLKDNYVCPIKLKNIEKQEVHINKQDFIKSLSSGAKKTYDKYGVFPSVTIAQAILESNWGTSNKVLKCNNLFGIKADEKWTGSKKTLPTKEWVNGKQIPILCDWRVYKSIEDSIENHGYFLYSRPWYSKSGTFKANNYKEQIIAIHKAGYATDPKYPDKICSLISRFELWKYDENGKDLSKIN